MKTTFGRVCWFDMFGICKGKLLKGAIVSAFTVKDAYQMLLMELANDARKDCK